ncbi:MAG TPA: phosphatase PAP2 family protein [Puia sp.]|nr:phosphatase PAP2 family protein [Puia sp.]
MNDITSSGQVDFFGLKRILIISVLSVAYLLLSYWLLGFRPEQFVLIILFNTLYFISASTRKFILGFAIFIVYWIIFDYMKAFPNYNYASVHIESLYLVEKKIFGIDSSGIRLTPNEYWLAHGNKFLDVLSGLFYLAWIPFPLIFGAYLFYNNKKLFFYFSFTFFLVNILGFIIYYSYPAAPPWYIQQYGFHFYPSTPGTTAGLAKFDKILHVDIFKSIYEKSSNVFAAMPSLHSAYPLIVVYYGIRNKMGLINLFYAFIMMGIWFAAVYTGHHYILDILAGIICGILGIILFNFLISKSRIFNEWIGQLVRKTS